MKEAENTISPKYISNLVKIIVSAWKDRKENLPFDILSLMVERMMPKRDHIAATVIMS